MTVLNVLRRLVARKGSVGSPVVPDAIGVRAEAKAEYEAGWRTVLDAARALHGAGEVNLARMLSRLDRSGPADTNKELLARFGFRFCGVRVRGPQDLRYESMLFELTLQNEILGQIDADTANIIELGSGYGKNLFRIWLNGGPATACYHGFEYTEGGRDCATFLASLEKGIAFSSSPFDYHLPQIDLSSPKRKTIAFSSYSIEQIPEISAEVFEELLAISGLYRVVHVEPVGWQRPITRDIDAEERMLLRDTERSARLTGYNTNLLSRLAELESAGRIVIEATKYDFLAHRPNLPGSVIVWRPARPGAA
jgi:hypothetical protein